MSGRSFGVQSSWDDVFRQLGLDVAPTSLRKAVSIADSMNQQIEEFVNRYVSTSVNDKGSLVFDAAGTYTFDGDVVINGDLTIAALGELRTSNYVYEDTGWRLTAAGTAEFNGQMEVGGPILLDPSAYIASKNYSAATAGFKIDGNTGIGDFSSGLIVNGDFTADTTTLKVDSTNNRVGIGTTTPGELLDIAGNANAQGTSIPTVRITNTDTTASASDVTGSLEFFSKDASDPDEISGYVQSVAVNAGTQFALTFGTKTNAASVVEAMRIDHLGNVGIGTTSPITALEINSDDDLTSFTGTGRGSVTITNSDYASGDHNAIDFCYAPDVAPSARIAAEMTGSGSFLKFGTSNSYGSGVTNTALTITPGGQLKGTYGSAALPTFSFDGDDNTGVYRQSADTIGFSSGGTTIASFDTNQAQFDTDVEVNDSRLWVKNDGSGTSTVLIGNDMLLLTAYGMNSSSAKYTPPIVFGSTDPAFTTENPKALAAIVGVASEAYGNNSDGGMFLEFVINGNNPGTANAVNSSSHGYLMQTSGFKPRNDNVADCGGASNRWDDVYATNGTIITSDLREKTLLPDERLGLDFLLSLDGIAFTRTGGKRIHHGIAAQQVQAALGPDHAIWIEGDNGVLGVRHDELWGPQINANREIADRLERLEAAIMAS